MTLRPWHLAFLVSALSALGAIAILQLAEYPHPMFRLLIFRYLLFHQDLAGLALLAAIALAACVPQTHAPALRVVEAVGRHPWRVAAAAFLLLCLGMLFVARNHALTGDEYLALMQSRIFAEGRLTGQVPPDLLPWLVSDFYRYRWVMVSEASGEIAATYWPGFALILTPFSALGIPWACNPLLAALAVALIGKLAARLTGDAQAGGWAMLLALASPTLTGQSVTYFAMNAHLVVNLLYAWLLLERTPRRLFAAGLVGSLALLLHNPVPHILFATPWLVSLAWAPGRRRRLWPLAVGYLPALVLGLAWAVFMREMHGFIFFAPWPTDDQLLNQLGNLFWYWHFRMGMVVGQPGDYALGGRLGELVKLWAWTTPALTLAAAAGWWLGRRNDGLRLLGASLAVTLGGYLLVSFDQGYGWGARYVHPAFGALPILAAAAIVLWPGAAAVRGWFASAALLSLVCATTLRGAQIHDFMGEHLARMPAYEPGARQFVFVQYTRRYYTQDLVQNDPFLRDPVVILLSRSRLEDYLMMRSLYPAARQVSDDYRGHVWRLD